MRFGYTVKGVLLLLVSLMGWACTADVYVPSSHPTPLLEEKGDLSGALYASTNGADIHAAYGLTDHLGIGAAANILRRDYQNSDEFQKHTYGELSLIYFLNLSDGSGAYDAGRFLNAHPYPGSSSPFRVEFIGSAGWGQGEELVNGSSGPDIEGPYALGRYSKISLQSNIAVAGDVVTAGISPRLSYVSFYDLTMIIPGPNQPRSDKRRGIFWEPALFLNAHYENLKLQAQLGQARMLGEEPAFHYETFFVSVGLQVNFNVLR